MTINWYLRFGRNIPIYLQIQSIALHSTEIWLFQILLEFSPLFGKEDITIYLSIYLILGPLYLKFLFKMVLGPIDPKFLITNFGLL